MPWYGIVSWCFRKCCDCNNQESEAIVNDLPQSFQSTYTVRRISSFGQTIVNDKGEEKEIERHSSIVTYDGTTLPWTSKPAPIQPGVTHFDIKKQAEKLPTITESPAKTKSKQRWKKTAIINKKALFTDDSKKVKTKKDIQLNQLQYKEFGNSDLDETKKSHEQIFSKCKKSTSKEDSINDNFLSIPYTPPVKSISTPDLVHLEQTKNPVIKRSSSKDSLPTLLYKSTSPSSTNVKQSKASEAEKIAKQHGLDLSLYTEEALSPLNISANKPTLITSNMPQWSDEPVGILSLAIHFNVLQKMLTIYINAIEYLCGEGLNKDDYAVIIKFTLIGSKKVVKTSRKIEHHLRPDVDQNISFMIKDMDFRSMRVSLYNAEWLGKHDAIGYGLLTLQHLLEKSSNVPLKLYSQPNFNPGGIGSMQISLDYDGALLNITVHKIFNFDSAIKKWKLYTKIAYYSLSKKVKERVSNLVWYEDSLKNEITFDHSTSFKIDLTGKKHSYILITLKRGDSHGMFKSDKTLGRVRFGPCFYYEGNKTLTPWGRAILDQEYLSYYYEMFL